MMHFLIFFHDNYGPKYFHEELLLLLKMVLDDIVGVKTKRYNNISYFCSSK